MTHIHSYPSVFAIGHKMITDLFSGPVVIEEKVDGSQFSMSVDETGLSCRSKGQDIIPDAPEKMFGRAVATAVALRDLLKPGWVYRCEYLQKPKHNTLAYDRVPSKHLIVFDIATPGEQYMTPFDKRAEAERLGLECVPVLREGVINGPDELKSLLETVSVLGGAKVEGVVVKNYNVFTAEKKVAIGKYVSEAFKEVHKGEWRKSNPTPTDVTEQLINQYRTPARWQKAIQHLRESGTLEGSPRDIGNLMKEVEADIRKECADEIRDALFEHFWGKIRRGVTAGLPQWYKDQLLQTAFNGEAQA